MESNGVKNEMIDLEVYKNLPSILKRVTDDFSGREKDIVLLSSIGVLSACLPNVIGNYDGDDVYANLYTIIIAPPASGKGVMNYSRVLIEAIHDKIFSDSKAGIKSCEEKNRKQRKAKDGEYSLCPQLEIKILPANISSAEMYSYIESSKHGVLIIESEADTMSNMLTSDFGNYSDVLRKAFHHEPVSIARKMDRIYIDIKEPKLSMVMSGTPDQLKPLMKSKDNGLFSRFIYYTFDEIYGFKNVFSPTSKNYKKAFVEAAKEVYELYGSLQGLDGIIEFQLMGHQQEDLVKEFSSIHEVILEDHSNSFLSNLNRHGLILFRICMILTALRNKDINDETWMCSDIDFKNALAITKTILMHALIVHDSIKGCVLSKRDEDFLSSLGITFNRKEAIKVGSEKFSIPKRTVDDKLAQWYKKKAIVKIAYGQYKCILK